MTGKTTNAAPGKAIETPEARRDQVAAVSYRADGTPDQTKDFDVIIDEKPESEKD